MLFFYCLIGYSIKATKNQNWSHCKNNIPNYFFWKTLPRFVLAGCAVTFDWIKFAFCGEKEHEDENELLNNELEDMNTTK